MYARNKVWSVVSKSTSWIISWCQHEVTLYRRALMYPASTKRNRYDDLGQNDQNDVDTKLDQESYTWNDFLRVLEMILNEWIILNTTTMLDGVGSIDPKEKKEALKQYDNPKFKKISQPNYNGDEVEECCVQEWFTSINKIEYPIF